MNEISSARTDVVFAIEVYKLAGSKCNYSEKVKQRITADKQLITLNAEALFNGDIAPDVDNIEGDVNVLSGIRRHIYASQKCRNPDGTVNYTRLELI